MPVEVKIPQLGESITEAEIVRWLKADGDEVAEDEPLAEIETDKATAELPSPASGVLEILVEEGATVKPGQLVARIAEGKGATERKAKTAWARAQPDAERKVARESEPPPPPPRSARPARPSPSVPAEADDGVATDRARDEQDAGEKSRPSSGTGPRPAGGENAGAVLSPAARRIAEENDVDPERVRASGRGGRVTKQDVLSYLEGGGSERDGARERGAHDARRQPPAEPDEAAGGDAETASDGEAEHGPAQRDEAGRARDDEGAGGDREERRLSLVRTPAADAPARGPATTDGEGEADGERRVRMSRLRRSIAQRLVDAQQTAAILTTFNEIDMTRVMEVRGRFKDKFAQTHGVSLGFMSFFARACILSIRDIPEINARIEGDEVVYSSRVHLGIAASTDRGLVVPVVRDADTLTLADLEREIGRLAELARSGRIGLDDLTGGTFTISNGGVFGSLLSTPILNPPQSAILGMHKIEKRPVVVGDQIVARSMMYVALSYDHRLIDGREAVTYLVRVKERIEDPERLLLEI